MVGACFQPRLTRQPAESYGSYGHTVIRLGTAPPAAPARQSRASSFSNSENLPRSGFRLRSTPRSVFRLCCSFRFCPKNPPEAMRWGAHRFRSWVSSRKPHAGPAPKSVLHLKKTPMGAALSFLGQKLFVSSTLINAKCENISCASGAQCCTSVAAVHPPVVRRTGGF